MASNRRVTLREVTDTIGPAKPLTVPYLGIFVVGLLPGNGLVTLTCPDAPAESTPPVYSSPQSRQRGTPHLIWHRLCKS